MRVAVIKKEDYRTIVDRMIKRLKGVEKELLSLGGRVTFMNTVLSTIPLYILSMNRELLWIKIKIDQIRKKFRTNKGGMRL